MSNLLIVDDVDTTGLMFDERFWVALCRRDPTTPDAWGEQILIASGTWGRGEEPATVEFEFHRYSETTAPLREGAELRSASKSVWDDWSFGREGQITGMLRPGLTETWCELPDGMWIAVFGTD